MRTAERIPYLSQANFLGEGFDIYGKYDVISSAITPLFDPIKAGTTTFDFLGREYVVPSYVLPAEDTQGFYKEFTGETRDSFQNNLSQRAEVHASYGAFSGQMEESYSSQFASNSEHFYSYRSFYTRLALLQLIPDNLDQYLTDYFQQRVEQLPTTLDPNDIEPFADFFDDFGIYFISEVTLGGSLDYYVAVSKTSKMSTTEISGKVKLDYNALFQSAGVSAEVKNTQSWQSYSANRSVNIAAKGGDPPLLAKLTGVDPDQPNSTSVSIYNQWLDTIDTNPAITDFKLKGIWELCGDKRQVVEQAFHEYGRAMRPRMIIEISSEPGNAPMIILSGDIRPSTPPEYPQGYQLVVLDRTNPSPAGVRLNKYYTFDLTSPHPFYYQNAQNMYNQMLSDIQEGGFDNMKYFLVLASFGMSGNAPPPSNVYGFLRAAGGGSQLQGWVDIADPGSTYERWVVYALTGVPNLGPSTGVETFGGNDFSSNEFHRTLEVLFYRQSGSSLYSLGAGSSGS